MGSCRQKLSVERKKKSKRNGTDRRSSDCLVLDHSLFFLSQTSFFFYLLPQHLPPPSSSSPSQQSHVSAEVAAARTQAFVDELRSMPVAIQTAAANEQHYEVPTPYFLSVLGPKLKYSSCVYPSPKTTLEQAEMAMLELACERADLKDGQDILEFG